MFTEGSSSLFHTIKKALIPCVAIAYESLVLIAVCFGNICVENKSQKKEDMFWAERLEKREVGQVVKLQENTDVDLRYIFGEVKASSRAAFTRKGCLI